MPANKQTVPICSGQSLANQGSAYTSPAVDLSTCYGGQLDVQMTTGLSGTGSTFPGLLQIQVANDSAGSYWCNFGGGITSDTGASITRSYSIEIPPGPQQFRLVASGGQSGSAITLNADFSKLVNL